jgi:hypothetical protein
VSDNTSTSYADVLDLSVGERQMLIELINKKMDETAKAIENASKAKKKK